MHEALLQIGALAELTGASPKALRLYEELGLLPAPQRRGRYRVYGQLHVDTVSLIRQAMRLGFKPKELQRLAKDARLVDVLGIERTQHLVQQKQSELEAQIQALQRLQQSLAEFSKQLQQAHELACLCPQIKKPPSQGRRARSGA